MKLFLAIAISLCIIVPFISGEHILVHTILGKRYGLDIDFSRTVYDLKTSIGELEGIPAERLKLVNDGRALKDDDKTLNDYNVQPESTVEVVFRLQLRK